MDSINPQAPGFSLGQFGVKAYRFRGLVRRNWWVLAITIALGVAYQGWTTLNKPRLFESTTQMNIREEVGESGDSTKFNIAPDAFVATTLAMLKSPQVLQRAADKLALETPDVKAEWPEITSSQIPRSYIFQISGRGKDPAYTQRFVDAVAGEFINFRNEQRGDTKATIEKNRNEDLSNTQAELKKAREKFQQFVLANNMPFWAEQAKQSAEYLASLKTREAALQTDLQRLKNLTPDQLLNSPSTQPINRGQGQGTPDAAGPVTNDLNSLYLQRMQDLAQVQARVDEQSKIWKPKHPRMQALREQLADVQRSIDVIKQQNRDASVQRVDAINAELRSLKQGIATWEQKVLEASQKDAEHKNLEDDIKHLEAQGDRIQQSIEANYGTKLDIFKVLQKASPPVEVPNGVLKHLIIGFIGGGVIGIAILIFLDRADDRMTSSSEMMEQFNEPILGQIPDVMESRGASGLPLLQIDDERYTFAEAFRSLRSSLIFMPNQGELRTLLVTSAIPNEGKSTIASNLAITMAASGANVVVVDADLRRGDLASLFDTDGRTGLSNILRGEIAWRAAAQTTKYPQLTLIPRGPVTSQSSELLLLPSVDTLLEDLKENFDLVIFNTAPILATDDTPTLSPHFDGTLMVIRAQFTSARLTKNALNALYQRQVNVLGLILNCVDTEMPDYYYYRYPKYYAAAK